MLHPCFWTCPVNIASTRAAAMALGQWCPHWWPWPPKNSTGRRSWRRRLRWPTCFLERFRIGPWEVAGDTLCDPLGCGTWPHSLTKVSWNPILPKEATKRAQTVTAVKCVERCGTFPHSPRQTALAPQFALFTPSTLYPIVERNYITSYNINQHVHE